MKYLPLVACVCAAVSCVLCLFNSNYNEALAWGSATIAWGVIANKELD